MHALGLVSINLHTKFGMGEAIAPNLKCLALTGLDEVQLPFWQDARRHDRLSERISCANRRLDVDVSFLRHVLCTQSIVL